MASYPISYAFRGNNVIDRSRAREFYNKLQNVNGEQTGLLTLKFENDNEPMPYYTEEIVFKYTQPVDLDPTYELHDYQAQEYLKPLKKYDNLYSVPEQDTPNFAGNKVIPLPNPDPYNANEIPYKKGVPSGINKDRFVVNVKEKKKTTIENLFG